jgi:hypothetical protein
MNKIHYILIFIILIAGCRNEKNISKRVPIAKAGNVSLYYDEVPAQIKDLLINTDSSVIIQNYINKWAKRILMFQKAEKNLSAETKYEIERQLAETRENLIIYEYQRQMMLHKMDTTISDEELKSYYSRNENNFILTSNIVKALFIKLPVETPDIYRIKLLSRSDKQKDMQDLEALCYQFAEKFDDFNEEWITLDRLALELKDRIDDQENFLKRNTYYEATDSLSVYLVTINDYRLRGSLAPFEYEKDDIKRIIWNSRRIEYIKTLENGIYNEAIKENEFKTY